MSTNLAILGIGLDIGTKIPIPNQAPSMLVDQGCMASVEAACKMREKPAFIQANLAMCLGETISGKKLCDGGVSSIFASKI